MLIKSANFIDVEKIKKYIADHDMSRNKFAKKCDISIYTLRKILDGDYSYKLSGLLNICKTMNVSIGEILVKK